MPAPPKYMRFFPALYMKATIKMPMDTQGAYMRLLCLMWENGGSVENNDSYIAAALPINLNKWLKVKPRIMEELVEYSPGYLTQKKLLKEYLYSSRKSSGSKQHEDDNYPDKADASPGQDQDDNGFLLDESAADGGTAPRTVRPAAPPTAQGAAPPTDYFAGQRAANEKRKEIQRFEDPPPGGVANALARALDQSRTRINKYKKSKTLEESGCGQLGSDDLAHRFLTEVIRTFGRYGLHPPSDYSVVMGWIVNGCDLMRHVLAAAEVCLERIGNSADPPQSWKYFAKEVYARQKLQKENY